MDTITQIDAEITKLKALKDELTHEIDELQKESYDVKDSSFGLSSKAKALMATIIKHSHGMSGMLGEAIHHSIHKDFESAQDYLDYISQTISRIREYMSQIDQVISNLEKSKSDLGYMMQSVQTWLRKSKELQ